MSTTLYYNGVWLRDCETKLFDQKIQYDESRTDVIYSSFRIMVTSTLVAHLDSLPDHSSSIKTPPSNFNAGSTPIQLDKLSRLLNEKGKRFYFYNKGAARGFTPPGSDSEMILIATGQEESGATINLHPEYPGVNVFPAVNFIDVNNGPKPISVKVEQIYGGRSMRVSFEIEVCRKLCPNGFTDSYPVGEPSGIISQTDNVLNNRWYITESKDANWLTTRTIQGTLRVSNKNTLPHLMRYVVVPSLLKGYQRTNQSFATDPTDLVLKYRIEDKQRHEAPPAPAIDWSGEYVEAAGKHGAHQTAELRIRLTGPPGVDKQALLGAAGRIAKQRFFGMQKDPSDPALNFKGHLESSGIVDVIGEPVIELRIRYFFAEPTADNEDALRLRVGRIGEPLQIDGYEPDVWPVPLPYDNESLAGVLGCYLQHPCSSYHAIPVYPYGEKEAQSQNRPATEDVDDEKYDGDARLYPTQSPFGFDKLKIDQEEQFSGFPYTFIDIRTRYNTESGVINLPLATTEPSNGRSSVAVKLHAGKSERVFMMEATRVGRVPSIPIPSDVVTDPNGVIETLTNSKIELHAPENKTDGFSQEYRVLAEFTYAMSRPLTTAEKLRLAVNPTDTAGNALRFIAGTDLFTADKVEFRA